MIAIPLGRINVPTPGTDVFISLSAAQLAQCQNGRVAKVEVWPDTANTANVLVRIAGATVASLPKPASGVAKNWETPDTDASNILDPTTIGLGAATGGDGAFVTLWVN